MIARPAAYQIKYYVLAVSEWFSHGLGQKLPSEIVRALQHRPCILFLDEPTAGFDPLTRNRIRGFIRGLCRDEHVTVF